MKMCCGKCCTCGSRNYIENGKRACKELGDGEESNGYGSQDPAAGEKI